MTAQVPRVFATNVDKVTNGEIQISGKKIIPTQEDLRQVVGSNPSASKIFFHQLSVKVSLDITLKWNMFIQQVRG